MTDAQVVTVSTAPAPVTGLPDTRTSGRSEGTERLAELFSPDVSYTASPWREPIRGVDALAGFWEAERDGHDEVFAMSSAIVAVDGMTAVVRVEGFEEWPFAPDTFDGH